MLLQTVLFALYSAAIVHCQCPKDPARVIKAMNSEDAQLRVIFSHRGVQTLHSVENSVEAVDKAAKLDIDGIELDAQIAKDGTIWPAHDTRVGRITNFRVNPNDPFFDIFKDDPLGPKNPRIRDMDHDQLNALFLRNKNGQVLEGVHFHSLEYVLNHIKTRYPHLAVNLDVKSADAVAPAADLINRLGMRGQVTIQFYATWFPPPAVEAATKGVGFIVVVYVNMLDDFAAAGFGPDPQTSVESYLSGYLDQPNYVSMLPPTKNWAVSNDGEVVIPSGPGGFVDSWMVNDIKRGIGKVHVTNDYNLGLLDQLGHCCTLPSAFLATSKIFGPEGQDQRGNVEIVLKANDWVITDTPDAVLQEAVRLGLRVTRDNLC